MNINMSKSSNNITFKNIEALARGEGGGGVTIECCAGLFSKCSLPNGVESKAQYVSCKF